MYTVSPVAKVFDGLDLLLTALCNFHLQCLVVMVTFMCQFDCSVGCPDIRLNIILGVFVRGF